MCVCATWVLGAWGKQNRAPDTWELELWDAVWVLDTKLSLVLCFTASAHNDWAIFSVATCSFSSSKNREGFCLFVLFFSFVKVYLINILHKHVTFTTRGQQINKTCKGQGSVIGKLLYDTLERTNVQQDNLLFFQGIFKQQENKPYHLHSIGAGRVSFLPG